MQTSEIIQNTDPLGVQIFQPLASVLSPFATYLLQRAQRQRGAKSPGVLTVREVAKMLRVSTWMIYGMVKRGELPVVRVSNAIRIVLDFRKDESTK